MPATTSSPGRGATPRCLHLHPCVCKCCQLALPADSHAHLQEQPYGDYTQMYQAYAGYPAPQQPYHHQPAPHVGAKRAWQQSGPGQNPHELNRLITATHNPMQHLQLACDNADAFDAVNVATCLHRIAKNKPRDMAAVFAHPGYACILDLVGQHLRR